MEIVRTELDGVYTIHPTIYRDNRGYFTEKYNEKIFKAKGLITDYKQTNLSSSYFSVVRGLHLQKEQCKLISCVKGSIMDVVIDLRKNSSTYKKSITIYLTDNNMKQVYIPDGCAHGFSVISETGAIVSYQVSTLWDKEKELSINPLDKNLEIEWCVNTPILSDKDKNAPFFVDIEPLL